MVAFSTTITVEAQHFSRLNSSQHGINFVSRLLPDHPKSYLYHSGMTCSGIAAGDVDGDGKPDLFLANGPGSNALYLQTDGSFQFEDVSKNVGVAIDGGEDWAAGVAMADVDNDGDLDFYLLTNRLEDPNGNLTELPIKFERPGVPSLIEGAEKYYGIWIVDADNWGVEPLGRADISMAIVISTCAMTFRAKIVSTLTMAMARLKIELRNPFRIRPGFRWGPMPATWTTKATLIC